jgi:hypothetical protein
VFDEQSESQLVAPAKSFVAAYERLLDDLERALWYDDAGNVVDAYQEYTDAYAEALSDPLVYQRVAGALERLTDALRRALERLDAREQVDGAVARYLEDVGSAWPSLLQSRELDSLVAVATGMATLAWLNGLGSSGLVSPFGATELFPTLSAAHTRPSPPSSDGWNRDVGDAAWAGGDGAPAEPAALSVEDDDGIVWQELSVGDDGQIVQHAASPTAPGRPRDTAPRERKTRADAHPGGASTSDPVALVERAYAEYIEALSAAGAPVSLPDPRVPAPGPPASDARADLGQRSADLTAAYLRLAQGVGSVPDLYLSYARFLGSATELVEHELALVRSYERLMTAAAQGTRPAQLRRAVDAHYHRFIASVREAWEQVEPERLSPDRLSALTATTARAAAIHDAATALGERPFSG